MNPDDLRKLAANPEFIPGIYNYCDRWCERCSFSSRCFLYATEREDPDLDDPDVRDLNNAKFWRKLESVFKDAHDLIRQCAEEAGVDLDAIDSEEAFAEQKAQDEDARRHELSVLARDYAAMVEKWFEKELADYESHETDSSQSETGEPEIDVPATVDVIRWYQFFIAAKVFRALLADDEEIEEVYGVDSESQPNPAQTDSNGSAKIALIAIERSISGWRNLQACVADKKNSIIPLISTLEKLRKGLEETRPLARDFIRPGFDEAGYDFVS
jgi:hypothetical protein